jgi:proteasome lid subunit RPN8/RPN11
LTRVLVNAAAFRAMTLHAESALPREVGGLLLGHQLGDALLVTEILVVPDPNATRIRYRRIAPVASQLLHDAMSRDDTGLLGYLGEWHSHPLPFGPSPIDRAAMGDLAMSCGTATPLIVVSRRRGRWRPFLHWAEPDGTHHDGAIQIGRASNGG